MKSSDDKASRSRRNGSAAAPKSRRTRSAKRANGSAKEGVRHTARQGRATPVAVPEVHRTRVSFEQFRNQPFWIQAIGVPLIYIPVLLLPFVIVAGLLTYWHLRLVGARDLKGYREFLPAKQSHRYDYANQITVGNRIPLMKRKAFWIFNCSVYCPHSVALFRWMTYMIMIVENWWCPFYHDKKPDYATGAIDKSFWHMYRDSAEKMHPDDRENPIWNRDASQ